MLGHGWSLPFWRGPAAAAVPVIYVASAGKWEQNSICPDAERGLTCSGQNAVEGGTSPRSTHFNGLQVMRLCRSNSEIRSPTRGFSEFSPGSGTWFCKSKAMLGSAIGMESLHIQQVERPGHDTGLQTCRTHFIKECLIRKLDISPLQNKIKKKIT